MSKTWAQKAKTAAASAYNKTISTRSGRPASKGADTAGALRIAARGRVHTRRRTSVPLVPPKPKLFFTARSILMSRAVLAQ